MTKEGLEPQSPRAKRMQWTVHPIKRDWKVSAGILSFLAILCAAIYFSYSSVTFLLLSVVILISSLASFFFPTTYILQDDCIMVKSLLRRYSRGWNFFKSYYPDKNGVFLSPFSSPSRLENFRGLYIRFGHNKAEVVDFIGEKIESQSLASGDLDGE